MASLSQLRYSWAGPTGLDYPGVEAAARMMGIDMSPDLFGWIRVCESTYLAVLAENRPKK